MTTFIMRILNRVRLPQSFVAFPTVLFEKDMIPNFQEGSLFVDIPSKELTLVPIRFCFKDMPVLPPLTAELYDHIKRQAEHFSYDPRGIQYYGNITMTRDIPNYARTSASVFRDDDWYRMMDL